MSADHHNDDYGRVIRAGDTLCFSYGIPPVLVEAEVIERDGQLIALTPGHSPSEAPISEITQYFNCWVKQD